VKRADWALYWRTARHLRLRQAGWWLKRRVMRPASRAMRPAPAADGARNPGGERVSLREPSSKPDFPPCPAAAAARRAIERREFLFLNCRLEGARRIPWAASGWGRLWDYHLHYFDAINVDLTAPGDAPWVRAALNLALDWIDNNPRGQGPGWEPYPLSVRLVNWLKFLERHGARFEQLGEATAAQTMRASVAAQARWLEAHLEHDVGANHLLKNAKALIFAGALLECGRSRRWLELGVKLAGRELQEQILGDGGHFERSPMYHAQVLEDLLDLETVFRCWPLSLAIRPSRAADELIAALHGGIVKMSAWLGAMLHPDGGIPLLNDASLGTGPPPGELLDRASRVETGGVQAPPSACRNAPLCGGAQAQVFSASGYATIRHEPSRSFLVFDCGPLGPDYQPGHGHCDLASFELSLHGMRVVVDTGTSTYEPGAIRLAERSTAAHNTLRIDGEEQAEVWHSFRVGRRPKPGWISGHSGEDLTWVTGHYSVGGKRATTHARAVVRDGQGGWWIVDWLDGRGERQVECFLHFHPQAAVQAENGAPADGAGGRLRQDAAIRVAGGEYELLGPSSAVFSLQESWYTPEFGMRLKNPVAKWVWRGRLPAMLALALVPQASRRRSVELLAEAGCCKIQGIKISLKPALD
jgi:hypothetical protein